MEAGREKNYRFLKKYFPEINISLDDFMLWAWKGTIYWGFRDFRMIKDFTGESTVDIVSWLWGKSIEINNLPVARIVTQKQRFNVLKRQGWKCNICGCRLKYSERHEFDAVVGHIDHIHPYSKKDTYPNGRRNINEDSNLQALCPKCNLNKDAKEIN
jgi:hypothetical protein